MSDEIALDTSVAVRFLNRLVRKIRWNIRYAGVPPYFPDGSNRDGVIVNRVLTLLEIVLPTIVVGELLFGAENSTRPLQNVPRYLEFIEACVVISLGRETATTYARTRLALKRKGRLIPMNVMPLSPRLGHNHKLVYLFTELNPVRLQ